MESSLNKNLLRFVIPSIIITTLAVFHSIIDGYFIGRTIGDNGLAAMNLSLPLIAIISSLGTGIGLAGAINIAITQGSKDYDQTNKTIGNTLSLLVILSLIISPLIFIAQEKILIFLGADQTILSYGKDYISIISIGAIFQILTLGINPIIRNIDEPGKAMLYIILGLGLNIILNKIFLIDMSLGMFGVGLATVLGQCLSALLSLFNLIADSHTGLKKSDLRLDSQTTRHILRLTSSSFGSAFLPFAILILTNWQILKYGGNYALAAFSILSYYAQIVTAVLQGFSYGVQPLLSFYKGSDRLNLVEHIKKFSIKNMVLISAFFMLLAFLIRNNIASWFGVSQEAHEIIKVDMIISSLSFIPAALVKFSQSYFNSLDQPNYSNKIVYLELLIITPIFLFLLPLKFGLSGVWYTTPISQLILALISINFLKKFKL